MKSPVKKVLKKFGYELIKLPPEQREKYKYESSLDSKEVQALDTILTDFANSAEASDSLSDKKKLKDYLHKKRLGFFNELLDKVEGQNVTFANKKVADIGSGTGYLLRLIQQREESVQCFGYDTFAQMNKLARRVCEGAQIYDEKFTGGDSLYDIVFCTDVLEHFVNPGELIVQMFEALKSDGYLILGVPNGRTDRLPCSKIREDGSSYWGHVNFWSPESWPLFLNATIKDHKGLHTDLYVQSKKNLAILRK